MEWTVVNPEVHRMLSGLGSQVGDTYLLSQDCHSTLDEILKKLSIEDRTLRTFRRAIGFSQVVKKDLLPLLINVKDDRKITDTTIKILVNLTMPVECLLPLEVMIKSEAGRSTIHELNWLLASSKEAFLDPRATRLLIDHITRILDHKLSSEDCESLNNCIVLLRNILHIPEPRTQNYQNQILWNLFAQNIDKVLIQMMTEQHRSEWGLAMVQLIALLYKDQHVATLQKLLSLWFEASLSESSEDNESNTSPPERGSGDSSSSMVTSDPTSDSSDNNSGSDGKAKGGQVKKASPQMRKPPPKACTKRHDSFQCGASGARGSPKSGAVLGTELKMECGSSEVSDCGYGTQVENQESFSTSSNEDETLDRCKPVHTKPANLLQKSRGNKVGVSPQDKEDIRRKKLVKRSRTNSMNMKALLHHTPSDEDISHLLKEFTVDFLLKGYGALVSQLREQLLYNPDAHAYMDTSHFFWLVTYFLKFATQLQLDLHHISSVLCFDVVSYLTYQGVNLCEQFELAKAQPGSDMTPYLRRIHLVVTAIRELVQAVESYKKVKHLSEEDLGHINLLQRQICDTEELRCLFVLLLRQFSPTLQSKQYLQDVIVTNHMLLSFIEAATSPDTLHSHMRQFVGVDVMRQYGLLLERFQENGQFVNDCVFTMMHHVAGDLHHVTALFQPPILKTFSLIWESDFQICDDWSDLIEYVIHKFISMPRPVALVHKDAESGSPHSPPPPNLGWSKEECDSLYWYFVQSATCSDPVGYILSLYAETGVLNKTRIGVIEQLLEQDVITRSQYNDLLEKEPISNVMRKRAQIQPETGNVDEVEVLKDHLVKEQKEVFVRWVQRVLLEACHAKLSQNKPVQTSAIVEPVAYYCTLLGEAIPVVAWTCDQCSALQYQPFVLLLHKLGLNLPAGAGKVFPRIPHFWEPELLYAMARKLGPLQPGWLKFDPMGMEDSRKAEIHHQATFASHHAPAYLTFTPEPSRSTNWLEVTQKSKAKVQLLKEVNLATMSISDEESLTDP